MPLGPLTEKIHKTAADRLEELQRANQNTLADLAVAIEQRDEAIASARQEPSRLDIAAMAMQGMLAASGYEVSRLASGALHYTDALIAAAKETK